MNEDEGLIGSENEHGSSQPTPPGVTPRRDPAPRQEGTARGGVPPDDLQRALIQRVADEAQAKAKEALRRQLIQDFLSLDQEMEEAEANAALKVQEYLEKKKVYQPLLVKLREQLLVFNREVQNLEKTTEDLGKALEKTDQATPLTLAALRQPRYSSEMGKKSVAQLEFLEANMTKLAAKVAAAWYRPVGDDESSIMIMEKARQASNTATVCFGLANDELTSLVKTLDKPTTSTAPAGETATVGKILEAVKPKMPARDFPILNWVHKFSGDETEALAQYRLWREQWDHAVNRIKNTTEGHNEAAFLHLLRVTLTGTAAKTASPAITTEAALAKLDARYDDIVGLVESYIPAWCPPGEARSGANETNASLTFHQRWPLIRPQLEAHGIEFDHFNGIRNQLGGFGGTAAREWRAYVKTEMRRLPDGTKLGEVFNWDHFHKWLQEVNDDAEQKEATAKEAGTTSAGVFAIGAAASTSSDSLGTLQPGCIVCGPKAPHKSASCTKVIEMSSEELFQLCTKKNWCGRCVQHSWNSAHKGACKESCKECGFGHLTSRHQKAEEAYNARKKKREPSTSSSSSMREKARETKRPRFDAPKEPREKSSVVKRLEKLERQAGNNRPGANKGKSSRGAPHGKNSHKKASKNEKKE